MKSFFFSLLIAHSMCTVPVAAQKLSDYVHIGITFGVRASPYGFNKDPYSFKQGYIRTTDSTLQISSMDRGAFIISTGVLAFPWMEEGKKNDSDWKANDGAIWRGIGFIGNLNIATIGLSESNMLFNRRVEGGFGLVYSFGRHCALSITYETFNNRRLRDDYFKTYEGKKLSAGGETITDLDEHTSKNSLFKDDYVNAISIKFVIDIHEFKD